MPSLETASRLAIVLLVAYFLGSLPVAHLLSRRYRVNILSTGTGRTGAANVLSSVGIRAAVFVFFVDAGRGFAAVQLGNMMGLTGALLLLPAGMTVLGHWNSLFTGFRGGDGLAMIVGVTVAVFGLSGFVAILAGAAVIPLCHRINVSSLLCIPVGYAIVVSLVISAEADAFLLAATGILYGAVLTHALAGHRERTEQGVRENHLRP